jgi:perosamine synthetase
MSLEPGAPASSGVVPLCIPEISGNEWNCVKDCLDSGWVSSAGPYVGRLEDEMARLVGPPHAVATSSGTARSTWRSRWREWNVEMRSFFRI